MAKTLIIFGIFFIIVGLAWHFTDGNIPIGKLPGDIKIRSGNAVLYLPITSCVLASVLLWLIGFLFRKF